MGHKKAENIETLFMLYDMLEADCQETLKAGHTVPPKEAAAATQLLDELRNRFVRLVCAESPLFASSCLIATDRSYQMAIDVTFSQSSIQS